MSILNFTYSIPYQIFLLYLIVLMFLEFRFLKFEKDIRAIRWGVIVGFIYFFGLRGFVFSDWNVYYSLFNKLPSLWDGGSVFNNDFSDFFSADLESGKAGMEKGFIYYTILLKSLFPNYHFYNFVNTVIDVILLNVFIKRYSPYYVLSFILFIALGGLLIECDLIRNAKAIFLFLLSIKYLQERRFIPYMLLNIAGLLFHSSAIMFFPLYFFLHKECPIWAMWAIFIVGNIIILLNISYIKPFLLYFGDMMGGRLAVQMRLYFVIEDYSQAYGLSIGYLERISTFLLLIFFKKKMIQQNTHNIIFINAYILYFITFFFFSEMSVAVARLTLLFVFAYWILYPVLITFIKEVANKVVIIILILLFCIIKINIVTGSILTKYDNILFGIESYEKRSATVYNLSEDNNKSN